MVKYATGYDSPQSPKDVKLVDGIAEIITWANQNKILVIEISNQPGIAKGKITEKIHSEINEEPNFLSSEMAGRNCRAIHQKR